MKADGDVDKVYCEYEGMLDEEVVMYARNGDTKAEEYLINKYKNYVKAKANPIF